MISGNDFWNSRVKQGMVTKKLNNEYHITYENLENNMYRILKNNAISYPEKVGVVDTNKISYSYKQMLNMTDKLSSYLVHKYKLKKGMHVGILLYNSIEFVVVFLAAQKIGATIIPYPTKYREPEIISLINQSDYDLLVIDEDYGEWFKRNNISSDKVLSCSSKNSSNKYAFQFLEDTYFQTTEERGGLEDKAAIVFTSGTTSFSKGVVIRNFNVQHAVESYKRVLRVDENDTTILAIPIYNVTGLIANLSLFLKCKAKIYLHKFFDVKKFLTDINLFSISFLHASPTIYNLMLNEKNMYPKLHSVKIMACGSSNMPVDKIKELKQWLPNIDFRTIYGLSETSSPATIFPNDASDSTYIGSSGLPIPGLYIKIMDDEKQEILDENPGEIWMKGTNVIKEYYNINSELITPEGWLRTGDIGYVNKNGYIYISDRKKDLINRGGEKIFSIDIENIISEIEGVHEVAVVGVKNDLYGEVPAAMLSLEKGYQLSESSLKEKLKKQIASYKIPTYFKIVNELQKTFNGKIDKKTIKSQMNNKGCVNNES